MKEISIIIRTYNSEKTVEAALKSAFEQNISEEYEVLVVDDGSTDRTVEILTQFQDKITLLLSQHLGAVSVLNLALKSSNNPYFTILDADDRIEPGYLGALFRVLTIAPEAGFAYCDYLEQSISGVTRIVDSKNIFNTLAGGILFSTDEVIKLGGYDESLVFPEYDLLIKLLEKYPGVRVDRPLYRYQRRGDSYTADKDTVNLGLKQLEKKYGKRYPIRSYDIW